MFIYRLLMLPSSRAALYMAKLSMILLAVLGLVGFQLLLLPLQNALFNGLIPGNLRVSATVYDIVANQPLLRILIPQTFAEFFSTMSQGRRQSSSCLRRSCWSEAIA